MDNRKVTSLFVGLIIGLIIGFILAKQYASKTHSETRQQANLSFTDTAKWQWADCLDAVKAAPDNHQVIFENDKIRILEVIVKPYELEQMHTHRWPSVMFGTGNIEHHNPI